MQKEVSIKLGYHNLYNNIIANADFIGNIIYENSSIKFILTDTGHLVFDSAQAAGNFDCKYFKATWALCSKKITTTHFDKLSASHLA
jgi:hypothetical protein